jgi:hypothetical protein
MNCTLAGKFLSVKPKLAILYVSTMTLIGIFGELFVNNLYKIVFGHGL